MINVKAFDAVDMTANRVSSVIDISELVGFAAHEIYTGSPTGTLVVEGSNDGTNFVTVDTNSLTGSAGQKLVEKDRAHWRYIRVSYTFSSGTGSLTVYVSGKRN